MIQHDADELKNKGPKQSIRDTCLQTSGGPSSAFKCTNHTTPTFNMQKHKPLLQIEKYKKIKQEENPTKIQNTQSKFITVHERKTPMSV